MDDFLGRVCVILMLFGSVCEQIFVACVAGFGGVILVENVGGFVLCAGDFWMLFGGVFA